MHKSNKEEIWHDYNFDNYAAFLRERNKNLFLAESVAIFFY